VRSRRRTSSTSSRIRESTSSASSCRGTSTAPPDAHVLALVQDREAAAATELDPRVYQDGWAGKLSDYSQFTTPGNAAGFAVVAVSRKAWGGKDKRGHVVIQVGALKLGKDKQPTLGAVTSTCRFTINRLELRTFLLATPPPPFHVRVQITPTFSPKKLDPSLSDNREFGAQVQFSFFRRDGAPEGAAARPGSRPGR